MTDHNIQVKLEDDAFKFAQQAGLLWYLLFEFDDEQPIYVLWSELQQKDLEGDYANLYESKEEDFADLPQKFQ